VAVFVDTNVFIYAIDPSDQRKQSLARAWLTHLWAARTGRTSTQVLSEYLNVVPRKFRPGLSFEQAWADAEHLLAWNPRPLDAAVLERARRIARAHPIAWYDATIVAAAQLEGCATLLSEDFPDGTAFGSMIVRSPFTLAVHEAEVTYASTETLGRPAPPRRGRPARRDAA
jgi:predicted nucleic acid-binding protein